ncbi:hypothetical protein [Actinokineospora sp.]|uniref:hypothetical protein n=1 Tax=Actinokineospora sp. TaxID=1872133 RepID=UPI003D6AD87E
MEAHGEHVEATGQRVQGRLLRVLELHRQGMRLLRFVLMAQPTEHVEWVRAAMVDALGVPETGGFVDITPEMLTHAAEQTRKGTLTWLIASAKDGDVEAHVCDGLCDRA